MAGQPQQARRHKLMNSYEHEDTGCLRCKVRGDPPKKAIAAHSIQRKGPLSRIATNGSTVMTFFGSVEKQGPHTVGLKRASVFRGLCAEHDRKTFECIERHSFSGTAPQLFAVMYRAACWELHSKIVSSRMLESFSKDKHNRETVQPVDREALQCYLAEQALAIKELMDILIFLETIESDGRKSDLEGWGMEFLGRPVLAGAAMASPQYTESGKVLQWHADITETMEWIGHCLFVANNKTTWVAVWRKDNRIASDYIGSLSEILNEKEKDGWPNWWFWNNENTFFNKVWWRNLSKRQQIHIEKCARTLIEKDYTTGGWHGRKVGRWELGHEHRWPVRLTEHSN